MNSEFLNRIDKARIKALLAKDSLDYSQGATEEKTSELFKAWQDAEKEHSALVQQLAKTLD
jgi:hypothetical protein